MMTVLEEKEHKIKAIEAGTDDFLTKPVDHEELSARVRSLVRVKHLNEQLENVENILFTLSNMLEAKDPYTKGHSERVTIIALRLANEAGLPSEDQGLLRKVGRLHDIGKIGVPANLLNKPGALTPKEFELLKEHVILGENICRPLRSIGRFLGIIRHHHENFDGTGYPDGLKGEKIPLGARILAIADAFDTMNSDQPYRKRLPMEEILKRLKEGAGSLWDPKLVKLFTEKLKDLHK